MTLALLDGDILAYRAASSLTREINWESPGEAIQAAHLPPDEAAEAAIANVRAWASLAGCKDIIVAFTGRENFRKRVLESYKANRAGKVKPPHYAHVVRAIADRFETRMVDGLEADDVIGILLTTPKYSDAIAVSIDKDFRTIPGRHLNPLKDRGVVSTVTEQEADYRWLVQTLTGDATDGYTGLPKCGPVKAAKVLGDTTSASLESLWTRARSAFLASKHTETFALQQARVARILRRQDYDKRTKEVLLWHPTAPERMKLKEPTK